MRRRKFVLASGSTILTGSAITSLQQAALGLEFNISANIKAHPETVDSILIDFQTFKIYPQYLNETKDATININVTIGSYSKTVSKKVSITNGKTINSNDLKPKIPLIVDEINSPKNLMDGQISITVDHDSIGQENYTQNFTVTDEDIGFYASLQYKSQTNLSYIDAYNQPRGFTFGDNGNKFYLAVNKDNVNAGGTYKDGTIVQYSLNNTYDGTTASKDKFIYIDTYQPRNARFGDSGSKLYVIGASYNTDTVKQYNLTTPWDIGTQQNQTATVSSFDGSDAIDIKWVNNGDELIVLQLKENPWIRKYTASTPWDISTISLDQEFVLNDTGTSSNFAISPNGDRLIKKGTDTNGNSVLELYSMSSQYDLSTLSLIDTNQNMRSGAVSPDGQIILQSDQYKY